MTNWLPNLDDGSAPLYVRLADRIEQDIAAGGLAPGTKLPPQRDLAYDLGVTIGTVGRAYALARERGLVSGEVGRGTYVLDRNPQAAPRAATIPAPSGYAVSGQAPVEFAGTRIYLPQPDEIRMDSSAAPDVGQSAVLNRLMYEISAEHPQEIASYSRTHPHGWLEAGVRWLACGGWQPTPASIVPTIGAHAGIVAVLSAMSAPGDRIAFESLTYCSFSRAAGLLGRRSVAVDCDENGMIPEEFERLCAQQHPKMLFLMPALHNPTLAVLSDERRRAIVEIARRYNVWLIEDGVYGALISDQTTPLAALAPERTFHVGSLSKAATAGVRGGWVSCPEAYVHRVLTAHKLTGGGIVYLLAELAARLVLSGAADEIRARAKQVLAEREALAREVFAGFDFRSNPEVPFLWMKLPDPWLSGTFKAAARREGVLVDDEDEFKPQRSDRAYHRFRVAFSAPGSTEEVRHGFETIRRLLAEPAAGYDSYA